MVIGEMVQEIELAVVGAGPGGYTAALRAAELGIKTLLIDAQPKPGGICLHAGCIPSKALLHAAQVINTASSAQNYGLQFEKPKIDINKLREWKLSVTDKLAQGIIGLCKSNNVEIIHGQARFEDGRSLKIEQSGESSTRVKFKHAIIATGSRPTRLPQLFKKESDAESPRILDSTSALKIEKIPKELLIVGGGYIGLELGTVYAALGSAVTVVEMTDGLLPGVDRDLVKPLTTRLSEQFKAIYLNTKVTAIEEKNNQVEVTLVGENVPAKASFESVLIAVGRRPNSEDLGLENTNVEIDEQGFVQINEFCQTTERRILAIGDVSGQPMLAHRAMRQAHVAAEVIAGKKSAFDNRAIPAVVFTEPEIAWCGLTENEAKANGIEIASARFPWSASGRALTLAEPAGHTKIVYDPKTTLVLGVGMVGAQAGDLIAEAVLAIEMGATLEDLIVSIHPHPTLSETFVDAALTARARSERQKIPANK